MGLNGDVILRWAIENVPLLLKDTKDSLHDIACLSMSEIVQLLLIYGPRRAKFTTEIEK